MSRNHTSVCRLLQRMLKRILGRSLKPYEFIWKKYYSNLCHGEDTFLEQTSARGINATDLNFSDIQPAGQMAQWNRSETRLQESLPFLRGPAGLRGPAPCRSRYQRTIGPPYQRRIGRICSKDDWPQLIGWLAAHRGWEGLHTTTIESFAANYISGLFGIFVSLRPDQISC